MSSMSLVLANYGLICASSKDSGESVHWHELDWAFIALKCDKYQISRFFPSFNASSVKAGETAHWNKLDSAFFAAWKCDKYQISRFFSFHLASKLLSAGKRLWRGCTSAQARQWSIVAWLVKFVTFGPGHILTSKWKLNSSNGNFELFVKLKNPVVYKEKTWRFRSGQNFL